MSEDDRDRELAKYDEPPDREGDEYLLEHRAKFRRPTTMNDDEKETDPKLTPAPPVSYVPSPDPLMQFFTYAHLPDHLASVSRPFCELAKQMTDPVTGLPRNAERTVMLRKLLEAKDCAVRALVCK